MGENRYLSQIKAFLENKLYSIEMRNRELELRIKANENTIMGKRQEIKENEKVEVKIRAMLESFSGQD